MANGNDSQTQGRDPPRSGRQTEATSVASDELAGIITHDLRNPLNNAQLYVDLAQQERDSEHLEAAMDSLQRMETLIETFTAIARAGEDGTQRERVELREMTRHVWADLDTRQAQLDVPTECAVRADRTQLQQLLENLFRNSVEHGSTSNRAQSDDSVEHDAKDILIRVDTLNDGSGFFVEDDGDGIPHEVQSSVFEYGYTTSETGTGYGLAIVREIARVHGWHLELTDGVDGGARIEITGVDVR
jgi:signal transduction histidine kinase